MGYVWGISNRGIAVWIQNEVTYAGHQILVLHNALRISVYLYVVHITYMMLIQKSPTVRLIESFLQRWCGWWCLTSKWTTFVHLREISGWIHAERHNLDHRMWLLTHVLRNPGYLYIVDITCITLIYAGIWLNPKIALDTLVHASETSVKIMTAKASVR